MKSPLFVAHIIVLAIGMFSFCAAAVAALLYLLEHRELKTKKFGGFFNWLPSLEDLDRWTLRTLRLGFLFLTLGMLTGLYLAHTEWRGKDWIRNPKFLLSVAAWFWYLILLYVRQKAGLRGGRFFALIAVGFLLLVSIFGGVMIWK